MNCVEISILSSMMRQLITYETGASLIGGCPDLDCGIFYIKQDKKKISILETILLDIVKEKVTYDDGQQCIDDGRILNFNSKLFGNGSKFVAYVRCHYGGCVALAMVDAMTCFVYEVNQQIGSSLKTNIFQKLP